MIASIRKIAVTIGLWEGSIGPENTSILHVFKLFYVFLVLKSSYLQGERDLVASTHVKQRVTHYTQSSGTLFQRPRIRLEYGAKVPQNVRQKYLDKLVDEYLCMYEDQQEAFNKVSLIC
jgi:hypothetical protein